MAELATVARPYARALYSLAREQNKLEPWLKQLALLAEISRDSKVKALIESPKIGKEQKIKSFLQVIGEDDFDPALKNFLVVLSDNDRISLISFIYDSYNEMLLETSQVKQATVYSAYPLNDNDLDDLIKKVEERCGVKLVAKLVVEPELIGGFRVEFGDQVLDMSVKSELASLYRTMIS